MNIALFVQHVASRKPVPLPMETKRVEVAMPPPCADVAPAKTANKCKAHVTLPDATVQDVQLSGRRQWIRLDVQCGWLDDVYDHLGVERRRSLMLSRYRTDFQGKLKVPLRLWTPEMTPLELRIQKGDVVRCAIHEVRAYDRDGRQVCAELHRDVVMVKQTKKRRHPTYFSDGD
tara:strand:- start:59 stop:580 length:522 start_codon:yes stop_codon:yes gene_type:complete